ncbi:MAG: MBG domain-containing protein [Coriobacteriales bacterium]|nr:MBG domain-containing protein [Coriobacteriales bacterium]
MRHRGWFAVCIALGLAMTLCIRPTGGIAEQVEVWPEGDETVVDVESGAEDTAALEAQDTQYVAMVQAVTETEGGIPETTYCPSVDAALIKWAGIMPGILYSGSASLILLDDCECDNTPVTLYGYYKTLDLNGHTLNMNGGTIKLMADGGNSPTFVLEDSTGPAAGVLKDCRVDATDRDTYGTFVLKSGTLTYDGSDDGSASVAPEDAYACVDIGPRGTLIMRGGTIRATDTDAYAVYAHSRKDYEDHKESTVDGGLIDGGILLKGRTDKNAECNNFIMSGGTITNGSGAGVVVGQNSMFTMTGGTVAGCTGGGVCVGSGEQSVFAVSGTPVVADNTKDGQACNVLLPTGKTIAVVGTLADGASVGVTPEVLPTAASPVVTFTAGYGSSNPGVFPTKYFFSDAGRADVSVCWDYDATTTKTEAALTYHQHDWTCDVAGSVLTVTCTAESCIAEGGNVQTLTLVAQDKDYDGKPAAAKFQTSAGWAATGAIADVTYYEGGKKLDAAPKDAGAYEARATVRIAGGEQVVRAPFTIRRVSLSVAAQDKAIAHGEAPANAGVTYAGFVGGEDASALFGTLAYDYGGYTAGSPAGTYAITPSGLSSGNYDIAYEAGVLTVRPAPLPDPAALPDSVPVKAVAHVQRTGTLPVSCGVGQVVGTTGKARRLESLRLSLSGQPLEGGIEYQAHVQRTGWQDWRENGAMAGTQGKARRIEAIRICLTGLMGEQYDVWYRVHTQRYGWMAWAKNGAAAGTQGKSLRAEAVQVLIVRKGSSAPGQTYNGVTQAYDKAFLNT